MKFKEEFKGAKFLAIGLLICVFLTGWIIGDKIQEMYDYSVQQEQTE